MSPLSVSRVALRGIQIVANDDVNRHAIAVTVVDRHGCVLQSDGAVGEYAQRLAFNLGVTMGHGDRRLFMAAGDEFGIAVAAVVDHRFMESPETRPCHGTNVL